MATSFADSEQTRIQWPISRLDAAEKDPLSASTTYLSPEKFERLCDILDDPLPTRAQELLSRKAIWE